MASCASASIRWLVSTSLPFTRPASAAFASPAPMLAATCATVTGPVNGRTEPSGSVTLTISDSRNEKSADRPRFWVLQIKDCRMSANSYAPGCYPGRFYPASALLVRGDISQPPWAVQPLLKPGHPDPLNIGRRDWT